MTAPASNRLAAARLAAARPDGDGSPAVLELVRCAGLPPRVRVYPDLAGGLRLEWGYEAGGQTCEVTIHPNLSYRIDAVVPGPLTVEALRILLGGSL